LTPKYVSANFSLVETEQATRVDGRSARMPAAERREAILEAAVAEFARGGLHGTATEDIARRAGITQPYVFRLFGTKKALYLETIERCFDRIRREFAAAAEGAETGHEMEAMGRSYTRLLADQTLLLGQMHSYADCSDPDVREVVRRSYGALWEWVEKVTGAGPEQMRDFFAKGMLMNVIAAMDLVDLDAVWADECMGELRANRNRG
jgi:AcrR family transcriptional regulator